MINIDRYEGHTPANLWGREIVAEGKRKILLNTAWLSSIGNDVYSNEKDRLLMADAPLLLEAYKRLLEQLIEAKDWVRIEGHHRFETSEDRLQHYKEYIGDDEQ